MDKHLVATAYHEAGHALLVLGLGFPLRRVSIVPDGTTLGIVELEPPAPARVEPGRTPDPLPPMLRARVLQAEALHLAAGAAGERLAGFVPTGCDGDEADMDHVCDLVHELVGVPSWCWRRLAAMEAERYLLANQRAHERLAAALMVERTLTGERAHEVAGPLPLPNLNAMFGALGHWARRAATRVGARSHGAPAP